MSFDFTVDRNSPKWVLGDNGYLKEYIADAPAIEFNADGSYKGVLVEPQSVNEAKASEDLDNATYWATVNTTIAGDTETDPKGGTNSFLLSETVDNGLHVIVTASAHRVNIGSGETWTQSLFVKKGDGANAPDIVQLSFSTDFGATNYVNFNINTGAVLSSDTLIGGIRDYGNGWYRISATGTSISGVTAFCALSFTNNDDSLGRSPSYAGQTDANVFVWGAQLEESPIATSYIPTTTGAVTRVKDDIYLTSASSLIGQTEGTMFIEVDWRNASGQTQRLLVLSDSTNQNLIQLNKTSGNDIEMFVKANNVTEVNKGVDASSYSGVQKLTIAYAENDFEFYRNGSSIATDTSGSLASLATLTDIDFGQQQSALLQANMWIRAVALFTTRLSDAEAYSLTGYDTYAQMANALQYTIL